MATNRYNDPRAVREHAVGRFVCGAILGLLLAGSASADYLKHYWDGREAYRNRNYRESVVFLDRAIKLQPSAGERVRWTGTHFETYLPHFHLGRALSQLGLYDKAARVWNESVRQGSILEKTNKREYRELQEQLERIQNQLFPVELERLRCDVESTADQLEMLQARGIGGLVVDDDEDLGEVATLLDGAPEEISTAHAQRDFAPLEQAGKAVDEARSRLLRALDAVERRGRERRRDAEARRIDAARQSYLQAAELLADGACSPEATAQLHEVLNGGGLTVDLQTGPFPLLELLSRAYEQCDDPLGAEQYLELARRKRPGDEARLRQRQERLAESRRRARIPAADGEAGQRASEQALSDYLVARATIAQRRCDPSAIATMESAWRRAGGALQTLAIEPDLDLARAYRACGDRERTRRYLDASRAQRQGSADDVERLEEWLKRTQVLDIYSESHALLVGVAHYEAEAWGPLPEVLDDLNEVERLLQSHGFTVQKLIDPTSEELAKGLQAFYGRKRRPDSRLVFYYGGHGHTETNDFLRLGYIVPADTPFPGDDPEARYLNYLVSMDGFEGFATATAARHAMFLFDSCFSGTIFNTTSTRFRMKRLAADPAETLAKPVRLFVTAGDETQMVPAESAFRAAVVRALSGFADRDTDGLILGAEIGSFVAEHGASPRNTPQWGMLEASGFDAGDLAFRVPDFETQVPDSRENPALEAEIVLWQLVQESGSAADLQRYLERYPAGQFVGLARWMLDHRTGAS